MGLDEVTRSRICQIMRGVHGDETFDAIELRIVWDADRLAKLTAEHFAGTRDELENMIQTSLRTETGRSKAHSLAQVSPGAGSTAIIPDA